MGPWGHEFPWTGLIQVLLKTVFKPEHRGENHHNNLPSIRRTISTEYRTHLTASRLSSKANLEEIIMLSKIMEQSCSLKLSNLQICLRV